MPKRLITHSEEFHTDDVFATALLLEIFPDAEVIRSRDEAVIASGDIVYDVGKLYDPTKGRFDHHQAQAGKRDNGITYSAFGLLWQEYGQQFCEGDAEVAHRIDQKLVMPIDANDNGQDIGTPLFENVQPFTIDHIITILNPLLWLDDTEAYDTQFMEAVTLAQRLLRRMRSSVKNALTSQQALLAAYATAADKRVVVMDKPAAASDIVDQCPELFYLVSPRPNNTWGIRAISVSPSSFQSRHPFPEAWRAQPPATLASLTGIDDVLFCHATGFYAVTQSKESALALAYKAINYS